MSEICRNRYVKLAVCFLCCFVLLFCQVAVPFMLPVYAIAGVDDIVVWGFILRTLMASLGINITLNPTETASVVNAIIKDLGNAWTAPISIWYAAIEQAWDGRSPFAQIGIKYGDFTAVTTALTTWLAQHMTADGSGITIAVDGGTQTIYKAADALDVRSFNNRSQNYLDSIGHPVGYGFASLDELLHVLGRSVIYAGNATRRFPYERGKTNKDFITINCGDYGGGGAHCIWDFANVGDPMNFPPSCGSCNYVRNIFPNLTVYFLISKSSGYMINMIQFYPNGHCDDDKGRAYYANVSLHCDLVGVMDVPLDVPAGSIDVPVTKDDKYSAGVVSGAWQSLIGQVGTAADSLPFNIPMTDAGAAALTPTAVLPDAIQRELATDIPAVGEVSVPKVDDLKLPSLITTKFPFCIPFDIACGVGLLAADPVAPHWEIPLQYGDILNEVIVLDFTKFDPIVVFMRWFQILIFTVCLAASTRNYIKW